MNVLVGKAAPEFTAPAVQKNTVIRASIDSHFSHLVWMTPQIQKRHPGYPIVSDINKTISRDCEVLVEGVPAGDYFCRTKTTRSGTRWSMICPWGEVFLKILAQRTRP